MLPDYHPRLNGVLPPPPLEERIARFRPDFPPAATLWSPSCAHWPPPGCNTLAPLQSGCIRVASGLHP